MSRSLTLREEEIALPVNELRFLLSCIEEKTGAFHRRAIKLTLTENGADIFKQKAPPFFIPSLFLILMKQYKNRVLNELPTRADTVIPKDHYVTLESSNFVGFISKFSTVVYVGLWTPKSFFDESVSIDWYDGLSLSVSEFERLTFDHPSKDYYLSHRVLVRRHATNFLQVINLITNQKAEIQLAAKPDILFLQHRLKSLVFSDDVKFLKLNLEEYLENPRIKSPRTLAIQEEGKHNLDDNGVPIDREVEFLATLKKEFLEAEKDFFEVNQTFDVTTDYTQDYFPSLEGSRKCTGVPIEQAIVRDTKKPKYY
jgi:hypothetical protein